MGEKENVNRLRVQLERLGVRPGGILLVHSSLRSLGDLEGGAETVVLGVLEALGSQGTLLVPALSYLSVTPDHPVFDVRASPSCIGALPEYFRLREGTLRSVHPTHSVCGLGARAVELLSGHERDSTPVGSNSPFSRLPQVGGQILFIGCGMRPNTSIHGIEEEVVPPYLYADWIDYSIRLANGLETRMRVRNHNFSGWAQRYERAAGLLCAPDLRRGRLLQADCCLVEAAPLWTAALAALRSDPFYFVEAEQ